MNKSFLKAELHKIEREIKIHGSEYTFERFLKDQYGEDTKEKEEVAKLNGIFHVVKTYISLLPGDAATVREKGEPALLVLYEKQKDIEQGDVVIVNNGFYRVTGKNNIQEYNIVSDISLEVVLDGRV